MMRFDLLVDAASKDSKHEHGSQLMSEEKKNIPLWHFNLNFNIPEIQRIHT